MRSILFAAALFPLLALSAGALTMVAPTVDAGGSPLSTTQGPGSTALVGCAAWAMATDAAGAAMGSALDGTLVNVQQPAPGSSTPLSPRCPKVGRIVWQARCWNAIGPSELAELGLDCATPVPALPAVLDVQPAPTPTP